MNYAPKLGNILVYDVYSTINLWLKYIIIYRHVQFINDGFLLAEMTKRKQLGVALQFLLPK